MPHLRVAASEAAFKKLFDKVVEKFVLEKADSKDLGPFTAGYDIKIHLENGSVDLRPDGTVQVKELDIKWDRLNLSLGIDIPEKLHPGVLPHPDAVRMPGRDPADLRLQRRSGHPDRAAAEQRPDHLGDLDHRAAPDPVPREP